MADARVDAGYELAALARRCGAKTLAIVGTGKNAGKTTAVAAVAEALERAGETFALCSIGRDGEDVDALGSHRKPAIVLPAGAFAATARALVPRSPAVEILAIEDDRSALGEIVLVRARRRTALELAGPPSANALRRIVERLAGFARAFEPEALVVIDGAVDRLAALRGGGDAIVVATGAGAAPSLRAAVDAARALVARLRVPRFDPARPFVRVDGALTASRAAGYARGERVQLVVADATQIAMPAAAFAAFARACEVRCETPLLPVACTVASRGEGRAFDPRELRREVARATGLPAFDVVAGACSR